jgi:DHA1 family multidrug resistance protein B-like MFS transporter
VTLFQLRITRAVSRYPVTPRLAVAMLLMGFPFFVLEVSSAIPVVLAVIVVFVIGEMLWVPTSQAIAAALAPPDLRGAYMGAFAGAGPFGFAVGPFFALQIRAAFGNAAMWAFFALVAVAAALLGAVAVRLAAERPSGMI